MDLRAVEYFFAVAERGTLRGAAARRGISQPALTKAIRRLEDELRVVLFDRQARGVTLTVYGRTLLRHARNLRASIKESMRPCPISLTTLGSCRAPRPRWRSGCGSSSAPRDCRHPSR